MNDGNERFKYYELITNDGSLYLYEISYYELIEKEMVNVSVMREFFTKEKVTKGYNKLYMYNEMVNFVWVDRDFDGEIKKYYLKEISPVKFLKKVKPYLDSEAIFNAKKNQIYSIFNKNVNKRNDVPNISNKKEKDTNTNANKILKKYL